MRVLWLNHSSATMHSYCTFESTRWPNGCASEVHRVHMMLHSNKLLKEGRLSTLLLEAMAVIISANASPPVQ